ncbi:MAG: hypothetical protein JW901_00905 [Dehalococcoidia bacterium]|nr:hypothetical protein [Dehalococcoidia bacterium]
MKKQQGLIWIALILVVVSLSLYCTHYLIFHDEHHIFIFLMHDLAFLPLEVLLVGIVVERILSRREREEKMAKLNMVISAFFSEVGNPLAAMLLNATPQKGRIIDSLHVKADWKDTDFKKARQFVEKNNLVGFEGMDIAGLMDFLRSKRSFMLTLIENPNVLEHESFSDLLLSEFHLTEELDSRPSLVNLIPKDAAHINEDIKRVYRHLIIHWLNYMQHLRSNYPYLYSHYLRIHPFQPHPSAIVE